MKIFNFKRVMLINEDSKFADKLISKLIEIVKSGENYYCNGGRYFHDRGISGVFTSKHDGKAKISFVYDKGSKVAKIYYSILNSELGLDIKFSHESNWLRKEFEKLYSLTDQYKKEEKKKREAKEAEQKRKAFSRDI